MYTVNALSIYLILQADSIEKAMAGFVVIFLIIALVQFGCGMAQKDWMDKHTLDEKEEAEANDFIKRCFKRAKIWGYSALFLMIFNTFTPSSKVIATMIVLPAIANNETVQVEAKEIYDLAKDALKQLVHNNEPAKTK